MPDDKIYAKPQQQKEFVFDKRVVDVFEDMIRRSVPGYGMMLDQIGLIARHFVTPGSNIYDLGCSLGASTLAIRHNIQQSDCIVYAIDNSPEMIEQCRKNISIDSNQQQVKIINKDIMDISYSNASMIVMNLTLQFVPMEYRSQLLEKIHVGMDQGGALILSEKIEGDSKEVNELLIKLYHDFKGSQGYSELEIAQKRDALENVLIPETIEAHKDRLLKTGFSHVMPWFQSFNFMSLIAIK